MTRGALLVALGIAAACGDEAAPERAERAAVEQIHFHVVKRPLDFPLGLTATRTTSHRAVAIVRGEGQKTRVIDRLVAIMGRQAAYTGQAITWDMAMNSQEDLTPPSYDWNTKLDVPPVAMPGVTKFS